MARKKLKNTYDVIVIGGGIVGAGILRDLSLHDTSTLLLEREDFSSQTSAGSSKMLHGGIRYLENLDFALVFEALKEKNLWLKLAPHITTEAKFFLPVYKESKWPLFFMRLGLRLYDLLSLNKNSPHRVYNKEKTLDLIPGLKADGLTGSGMYFDGIVDDSKLALDCILDALEEEHIDAQNYSQVTKVINSKNEYSVTFTDKVTHQEKTITAKHVVFATGPFTDQVLKKLNIPWDPVLLPSKGTHLWLDKDALQITSPMVLQTKDTRIIFVIPQRESILVGTTEDPIKPDADMINMKATPEEIDYLIESVNRYFPKANITVSNVLSSFTAVRPLVRAGASSSKTSRHHKLYAPQKNMHVIVGGKYTTFRVMAKDVTKKILKDLGKKYYPAYSLRSLKKTTKIQNPFTKPITAEDLAVIIKDEFVFTREDLISRRLSLPSIKLISDERILDAINQASSELKSIR